MHNYTKIPLRYFILHYFFHIHLFASNFNFSDVWIHIFFSVIPKDCNTNKACVWDQVYQECTTTPVLPER